MMDKSTTQIRIDGTTYEKTKVIAKRELRSVNNQIEYFMMKGVDSYEKENGVIDDWLINPVIGRDEE
jgi:hypothetical protein